MGIVAKGKGCALSAGTYAPSRFRENGNYMSAFVIHFFEKQYPFIIFMLIESMNLSKKHIVSFQNIVYTFYKDNYRPMPWRETTDPYAILVSEIMLQQTQVDRVREKYKEFLKVFPTVTSLARASLSDVLLVWSGLGYNRRAKFLHVAAQDIMKNFKGKIPESVEELSKLPGIGEATASAIVAYAYNKPVVYVETNIRTIFLHHFFSDREEVHDNEIIPLVEQTLDRKNPREWYWALMDYGVYLKKTYGNLNARSKHYVKQSAFEGSRRQKRARLLRFLLVRKRAHFSDLIKEVRSDTKELQSILEDLIFEGFVIEKEGEYGLH